MALASGSESKLYGSTINHIVNGAQLVDGAFSGVGDIDTAFTNADGYLWCDVIVTLTKAAAGLANLGIALYQRPLNLVSTNDQPAPSTSFRSDYVASKPTDTVTTEQYVLFRDVYVGGYAVEFYIENLSSVTINATWDLDIRPFVFIPA